MYQRYTAETPREGKIVGIKQWHAGPIQVRETLRETLLAQRREVLHWATCPECDPEGDYALLLSIVDWTLDEYIEESTPHVQ